MAELAIEEELFENKGRIRRERASDQKTTPGARGLKSGRKRSEESGQ